MHPLSTDIPSGQYCTFFITAVSSELVTMKKLRNYGTNAHVWWLCVCVRLIAGAPQLRSALPPMSGMSESSVPAMMPPAPTTCTSRASSSSSSSSGDTQRSTGLSPKGSQSVSQTHHRSQRRRQKYSIQLKGKTRLRDPASWLPLATGANSSTKGPPSS